MTKSAINYQKTLEHLISLPLNQDSAQQFFDLACDWKLLGRSDKALFCYGSALSFYENKVDDYEIACDIAIAMGHLYRGLGHHKHCRQHYFKSLKISRVYDTDTGKTGECFYHLATLAEQTWNIQIALKFYDSSISVYDSLNEGDMVHQIKHIREKCNQKLDIHIK